MFPSGLDVWEESSIRNPDRKRRFPHCWTDRDRVREVSLLGNDCAPRDLSSAASAREGTMRMVPGDSTECATFTVTDTKPVHSPEGQVGLLVNTVEAGLLALHFNLETVQRLRLGLEAA